MFKKLTVGHYQFYFGATKLQWIDGVTSELGDGRHILMWDFDGMPACDVTNILVSRQLELGLPVIYLLQSSPPDNWIAYSFKSLSWPQAISIVAATAGVDWYFVKFSMVRGYFTLRIGVKHGAEPRLYCKLPSEIPEDCAIEDLSKFVRYETKAD